MGKRQDWSVTACVFLFLSLVSQIHCRSEEYRVSDPSLRTRPSNVSQQSPKEKDLIKNLPGQPHVNFRQYGGYVAVNEKADRFLYYYFVEAINANDSTPLVIWFNGGPGCSSLGGALKSLGPFRIQSDGKTLCRNPYSWNNEANVLFLEGPIGVGFAYSNTPIDLVKEGAGGDKRTAEENYMFLVNWLKRFPEYKNRSLYLTGQSYAGHYVPQLAQLILHRNNQTFINLRGVSIGNPSLDPLNYAVDVEYEYMVKHALISQDLYDEYVESCKRLASDKCSDVVQEIKNCRNLLDEYNIYAPKCQNFTLSNKPKECSTVMEYDPCVTNYLTAYLNTKEVQEAMHANTTNIPYAWESCNMPLNRNWSNEDTHLTSQIPILHELMAGGLRVWLYSGDMDLTVPVTSTTAALKLMNLTVEKRWAPWLSGGEVGGYSEVYKGNLTFATVRGAGHSVPADQPLRALTLFTSFLLNAPLPNAPPRDGDSF